MSKYIAIWHQAGGCDYTIGCGIAVHLFEAADLEAAKRHVIEGLSDPELSDDVADSIDQVDIVEYIGNFSIMMPGTWLDERTIRIRLARESQATEERAEYERLKRKFEGR